MSVCLSSRFIVACYAVIRIIRLVDLVLGVFVPRVSSALVEAFVYPTPLVTARNKPHP
jgi:hypothetical protein